MGLQNDSGNTLTEFSISYSGEQWRNGGNTNTHSLSFEYGFGTSFSAVSSWTAAGSSFNFTSIVNTSTAAAVVGNVAGLAAGRGGTVTGLNWTAGQSLWLRWVDLNDTGNDHGLAIDDVSFTAAGSGVDQIAPTVTTLNPADNATNVALGANLVITFNEAIQIGTGNVVVRQVSDNSVFQSLSVSDPAVSIGGNGSVATINLPNDFAEGVGYYVTVDAGGFKDIAGNDFAGISGTTAWNFTTLVLDTTAPTVQSINDSLSGTSMFANVPMTYTINFSEPMLLSTFQATDFANAGTASFSIGAITQATPGSSRWWLHRPQAVPCN